MEPADDIDEVTGNQMGWVPVGQGNEDKYLREAFDNAEQGVDGTCEFLGPKSQGNVEGYFHHILLPHRLADVLATDPRDFESIKAYLEIADIEGIVWHHPDGRMVKIKAKDFGIKRRALAVK